MKKRGLFDANNSPILILCLGVLFLVAGILITIFFGIKERGWLLAVSIIFTACSAFFIIYGIFRWVQISKIKALDKNETAYVTKGKFIKARFSSFSSRSTAVGMGDVEVPTSFELRVFKKIIYTYTDQFGIEHKAKSVLSYTPNQVKYLQNLENLTIKCDGKVSKIMDEVPDAESSIDL